MSITASEARRTLFPLIEQVNDDRTAVEITSKRGNAVFFSYARPHPGTRTLHGGAPVMEVQRAQAAQLFAAARAARAAVHQLRQRGAVAGRLF